MLGVKSMTKWLANWCGSLRWKSLALWSSFYHNRKKQREK